MVRTLATFCGVASLMSRMVPLTEGNRSWVGAEVPEARTETVPPRTLTWACMAPTTWLHSSWIPAVEPREMMRPAVSLLAWALSMVAAKVDAEGVDSSVYLASMSMAIL